MQEGGETQKIILHFFRENKMKRSGSENDLRQVSGGAYSISFKSKSYENTYALPNQIRATRPGKESLHPGIYLSYHVW